MSSPLNNVIQSRLYSNFSPSPPMYTGPGLPPSFSDQILIPIKTDIDLVFDSIRQIIETEVGERLLEPEFGSRIRELIFEPDDSVFQNKVAVYITDAINIFEPRVSVIGYNFQQVDNEVLIQYTVKFLSIGRTATGSITLPRYS